jgi:hypothetical protein
MTITSFIEPSFTKSDYPSSKLRKVWTTAIALLLIFCVGIFYTITILGNTLCSMLIYGCLVASIIYSLTLNTCKFYVNPIEKEPKERNKNKYRTDKEQSMMKEQIKRVQSKGEGFTTQIDRIGKSK